MKCTIEEEGAFYTEIGLSQKAIIATARFNQAHNVFINQPYNLVTSYMSSLKSNATTSGWIHLFANITIKICPIKGSYTLGFNVF